MLRTGHGNILISLVLVAQHARRWKLPPIVRRSSHSRGVSTWLQIGFLNEKIEERMPECRDGISDFCFAVVVLLLLSRERGNTIHS